MIKDFLKEGTLYAIASVAAKSISLMLIPIFTAYFATLEFGIIEILYVVSTLATGLLSWQLGQAVIRFLGEHQHDPIRKKYISTTALTMIVASYVLGTLVLIYFRSDLSDMIGLKSRSREKTFMFAMIAMCFNGIYLFLGSQLQALRYKKQFAASQFLHSFLGIVITYFFVITLDKSINGVYYAAVVVFPLVILYQLFSLRKEFIFGFSKSIAKELLRFSLPMLPAGIALIAFSLSDRILIGIFSTQEKLGVYSVAFKFAFGLQLVISGYSMAIHPLVFQKYKELETKKQMSKLLLGYTVIGALSVILLSLFSLETLMIFTQSSYYSAYKVMPLLYTITWINGFVMFAPGMQVSKKTGWISLVICSALVFNILMANYLIPALGIKGAALGTLLSTIIYVVGLFLVSLRFYPYKFAHRSLVTLVGLTVASVVLASLYFEKFVLQMNPAAKFSLTFILLSVVVFFFVFQNLNDDKSKKSNV